MSNDKSGAGADAADIVALRDMIVQAERVVVFTGAGISTESGIPDFRSPQGIWSKMRPIQFDEFVRSEESRCEAWRRKIVIDRDMGPAEPNRGHRAVAALVEAEKCACVITQNIDGLHQKSGIPDARLVELHGNGTYAHCLDCLKRFELVPLLDEFQRTGRSPRCDACGGLVKTATVSFGQQMPAAAMERATEETLACDFFLVLGSSLVVHPAASFPLLAKDNGAWLAIVNHEATPLDDYADLVVHASIGALLGEAVGVE